ncbi:hypothetical protein HKK55_09460 [Pseudomonas sp. ADAK18]|uniref:hypothetical protein n=1 Tax=Pseudomonas sp. ADAK18 TaxID=2730848 RepID=UPI00146298F2|nr:hypothetical protein [Pseudomonas sp. ADAK18]QJI28932.1 hypothetical protein HKK55_09460 [Pseudomonas sp. ADAK18]
MDLNEKENKPVTAKELLTVMASYHSAIARLGSGLISLSGVLMESNDPVVKEAAGVSWEKLNEFIGFMDQAAEKLGSLIGEETGHEGE